MADVTSTSVPLDAPQAEALALQGEHRTAAKPEVGPEIKPPKPKRRKTAFEKCLFCGADPIPRSQAGGAGKSGLLIAWKKEYGALLCSALSLPQDSFLKAFSYGPYCSECSHMVWDLSFAKKQMQALEARIGSMTKMLEEKIDKHHRRLQKTTNYMEVVEIKEPEELFSNCLTKNLPYRAMMLDLITKELRGTTAVKYKKESKENQSPVSDEDDIGNQYLDSPPWVAQDVKRVPTVVDLSESPIKLEIEDSEEEFNFPVFTPVQTKSRHHSSPKRKASVKCKQLLASLGERNKDDDEGEAGESNEYDQENQDAEFILPNDDQNSDMETDLSPPRRIFKTEIGKKRKKYKPFIPPADLPCDLCGHICNSRRKFDDHMRDKHPGQTYPCEICKTKFKRLTSLQDHVKKMHANAELPHICFTCKMRFATEAELGEHGSIHDSETPFKCAMCLQVLTNSQDLERHVQKHANPFACNHCSKSFTNEEDLKIHVGYHSRSVTCEICGQLCHSESRLKAHMRAHSSVKEFQCDLCPLSYRWKKGLIMHMRIHTGERPFVCRICSKGFYDSGHLKKHEMIHSGTKTYVCPICGKSFKTHQSLKQHERGVHHIGLPTKKRERVSTPRKKLKMEADTEGSRRTEAIVVTALTAMQTVLKPKGTTKSEHTESPISTDEPITVDSTDNSITIIE